jgi:hypothetical protein
MEIKIFMQIIGTIVRRKTLQRLSKTIETLTISRALAFFVSIQANIKYKAQPRSLRMVLKGDKLKE